jgi:hypothetical protein
MRVKYPRNKDLDMKFLFVMIHVNKNTPNLKHKETEAQVC